jgi:restriction system protein
MNEEDIPKYWEFANPILKYLKEKGTVEYVDIISKDVSEILRKERNLPESVYEFFKVSNGISKMHDRSKWGISYLVNLNYIKRISRGLYEITEKGIIEYPIDAKARFSDYAKHVSKHSVDKIDARDIDGEILNEDEQEIEWQEKLLKILRNLKPKNFENLCKKVLEYNGFVDVQVTGKTGDCGIDGIGILRQSLISTKVLFQCKRYNADNKINPSTVRDFRGSMSGRANYGLIITTSEFTQEAKKEAKREGVDPIELIDGWELCTLIKKTNELGVKEVERIVKTVEINKEFYEKFDN